MTLSDKQIHDLARLGAIARLQELDDEAATIKKAFPGLTKAQDVATSAAPVPAEPAAKAKTRKRKKMSAEQRKAVGARMAILTGRCRKRIWAGIR